MLEDYLVKQLYDIKTEIRRLSSELQSLCDQETMKNNEITSLLENEDVGLEIFSPRALNSSVKNQILEIKKTIHGLQEQEEELRDRIAIEQEQESVFSIYLEEYQILKKKAEQNNA